MNYEIAKQLYKKGSPFKCSVPVTEANAKYLDFPALSELIEACGDGILGIQKVGIDKIWYAVADIYTPVESKYIGSTPEEAVAKLWLELNKK